MILSDTLGKSILSVPMTIRSTSLEVLVPEWEVLLPGATINILLNWNARLPTDHFRLLMPLSQLAKEGITVLGVAIDPDCHGEIGFLLHNGGKKD